MLGLVEHGQQHVQLAERVGQPDHAAQAKADAAARIPAVLPGFLRTELPRILAARCDVLSPRMIG